MIEIRIPKLGLTMEKAMLHHWEFRSGEEVKEGQTILVIETDKVTFEVPSPEAGIIHPIAPEGETCAVEEVVGYLAKNRVEYEQIVKEHPSFEGAGNVEVRAPQSISVPGERAASTTSPTKAAANDRIKSSPVARAIAGAHKLDLRAVSGSGPGGRIVRADVLRALEAPAMVSERVAERPTGPMPKESAAKEAWESIPIQGVRRIIFDNMFRSLSQSAQLSLHTEACAEPLVRLRERLKNNGRKVSYNAVLIKICAMALRLHPRINASVEGDVIRVWRQIHVGLAMEHNDALIVPVVRNPDLKTIREIDTDILELVEKTRENRLSPDDLLNGTFTVTNLGFAEIDYFTPIIRPPESAILGVGRIVHRPSIRNDIVIAEKQMTLSLTIDHRIIDGAPGARFLKTIKEMVEDPVMMIG
jgi:pyruvate dehydrogenase complex dihydrolipoamide acetyltransferase long form